MKVATKAQVNKLIKQIIPLLGLSDWVITVTYNRDDKNFAVIMPQFEYRRAKLNIDLESLQEHHSPIELIAHELAHCVVAPMGKMLEDLCEEDPKLQKTAERMEEMVVTHIACMACVHQGVNG